MSQFYVILFAWYALFKVRSGMLLRGNMTKKCHFGNSACIIQSSNDLIRNYPKGIPEIGLPPLDVTALEDVNVIDRNTGPMWFQLQLKDNTMKGFNNATITHVEGFDRDPTIYPIEVRAHIPSLVHVATYNILTEMLLFKINSTDKLESDFQNVTLSIIFKVFLEYRNNKRYLRIYDLVPKVNLNRWILWLKNLFKENSDLTIAINQIYNENWVELWNEVEPGIMKSFTASATALLNIMFEIIAYDDMFLPDPLYNLSNSVP